jgi:imidazoleglycerol-phosphate dehydratase/histidinol-phosphatase
MSKRKVLFIDRDGTIVQEPPVDYQLDRFEKLAFLPGVFHWLGKIARELDFDLVMVTNQDGLGTDSFPEDTFWPVHNLMIQILESEQIFFKEVCIDRSFPHENLPTRKPGIGMLQEYLKDEYDLKNSWVIGDRPTDVQLAQNLGAKSIFIENDLHKTSETVLQSNAILVNHWEEIYRTLKFETRVASLRRTTNETDIQITLNLDGQGKCNIHTGLGFFDHMLEQLGKHSGADLDIQVKGDLHIDEHHTIEDTALALGACYLEALGDKRGIERYGYLLPMDDCLAQAAIDFSGRPWLVWDATFKREKVGDMPTELFYHFWKSFSDNSKSNLNIKAEGDNEHHKIEAIFKAVAKSIKMAVKRDPNHLVIPSTKGVL